MTSGDSAIRVVLVDDEPLMRTGLRLILQGAGDIVVVGEAATGQEALDSLPDWSPDVVLMDIRMPVLDGIGTTRALVQGASGARAPRVLVLTAFDTDGYILEALRAGASGFLLKDTPPGELVAAVRSAAAGTHSVSRGVLGRLVGLAESGRSAEEAGPDPLADLSEREREIAECVAAGMTNGEIAAQLFVSLPTVKTHIARVFDKLGVTNRVQLAILVLESR